MAQADAAQSSPPPWKPLARMRTHEHVVAEIENRLVTGALKAGDRLPPERQFAEALGVSRGAVREALRILEAIGVLEAGTGSGPSAGSVIVRRGVAGMAMVMRLHLRLASFSAADLSEIRLLMEQLAAGGSPGPSSGPSSGNALAALLAEAMQTDANDWRRVS
jgi:DNA-binding FadR family transcriptional regulator